MMDTTLTGSWELELYIGEIWQSRRETSSTKDFWRVATNTLLNNGVGVLEQTELDHLIDPDQPWRKT